MQSLTQPQLRKTDDSQQEEVLSLREELEKARAELQSSVGLRDEEVHSLQQDLATVKMELQSSVDLKEEEVHSLQENLAKVRAELQSSVGLKEEEVRGLQEDLAKVKTELQQVSSSKATEPERLRAELDSAAAALEDARRARDNQARDHEQSSQEVLRLRDEVGNLHKELQRTKTLAESSEKDMRVAQRAATERVATAKKRRAETNGLKDKVRQLQADRDGRPDTEVEALRAKATREESLKLSLAERCGDLTKQVRRLEGEVEVVTASGQAERERLEQEQRHSHGLGVDLVAATRKTEVLQRALRDMQLRLSRAAPSLVSAAETGEVARRGRPRAAAPPPCEPDEVWCGRARSPERVRRGKQRWRERREVVRREMEEKQARERDWEVEFEKRTGWKCPARRG
ncbi:hypothetical protein EV356DRAFT_509374 [Viridothelium virens]|uniref:Uncharacterized protein n=1 Tax=Viridothelium virens TaxID=1048519 RepID=A0A6A6GX78_VIRVR|nr:hypothetical protein EV356DRAFT_509374 [Viridothelium virens]